MNNFEKEKIAVKAYRLAEMSDHDWKKVMLKYGHSLKEWWVIPTNLWYFLSLAGIVVIIFNWFSPWLRIIALLPALYAAMQIGSRAGNVDGFQIGYEWGKEDGVCKGMGIDETEKDEFLRLARDLIVEFKVESGDPMLGLGKRAKDD
ncbi:MAG: hypothetical protein QME44_07305 [Thermodesulfobacteriota bacterium]|nr:hypothetical protein [Thermodesulfobacteriota bacterium]